MIVLFSPSEDKLQPLSGGLLSLKDFRFKKDERLLKSYDKFIKNASKEQKFELFGCKKEPFVDIFSTPTAAAISLYTGVAYKELDFKTLDSEAKEFCKEKVIIFSNLFGPVLGGEKLPFYKLKQGKSFDLIKLPAFYKEKNSKDLDGFLKDEEVIDLRAGYYEGFYSPFKKSIKIVFKKNGKILSHNAKKYRGKLLRLLATRKNLKEALGLLKPLSLKQEDGCYELDFA